MRTEENCVRDRDRREGKQKERRRARERRWELYKRQLVPSKKKAQDYASHSERRRNIERDQKISCCCCSHHYVKDRARLRTYSRRFCLIFDTENVSSWSVSILLTLSTVEYQHEYNNDYHHHWIKKRSIYKKKQTNK